ncbi:MAG TPA: N,N-dimethylformamidase beta subunit family domain-containing protein [Vicinamibacterales bacterium]|nr:N,N-dimethylformamidase beta subunit family domain-containing protein [Vicinamibacterales bacterium]
MKIRPLTAPLSLVLDETRKRWLAPFRERCQPPFTVFVLTVTVWIVSVVAAAAQSNPIQAENAKAGSTDWLLTKVVRHDDEIYELGWQRRKGIEAYASKTSVVAGDTLNVHVSTYPANKYSVSIYRMGYYGGAGARLMRTMGPLQGTTEPTPNDGNRSVIECTWKVGFSLEIPKDWLSGVYLGKLSTLPSPSGQYLDLEMTSESYVVFIVRDNRRADLLFQASDMTWLSYNRWPQWRSMYDLGDEHWGASNSKVGYDVSFDRPYALYWNGYPAGFHPLTNGSGEFLMTEFPLAFWLEKEGYDVTYISNVDTHADGNGLLRAKVFLSVGHDEYWTERMFENVMKARDAGVSLAFLSGNSISGIVELLPAGDGRPNRVMRRAGGGFPREQDLMGATSYGVGFADWTAENPEHWVFEGTNMKKGDRVAQLVGWEYHGPPLATHPGLVVLSEGAVYGAAGEKRTGTYATTLYAARRGNLVFNAGTCWWNVVLSSPPGFQNPPRRDFRRNDARIQRITKNILDRMIRTKLID